MICLDLCCGKGGWSKGFHAEGFDCIGIDIIDVGYPYKLILEDLNTFDGTQFKGQVEVVVGSPPCRDFTILGDKRWKVKKNPQKGLELVHAFLRVKDEVSPKYWLMENVVGLEKHLDLWPKRTGMYLTRYMKRSFWGEFPDFQIIMDKTRGKMRESSGWPKMAKYDRAEIPMGTAQPLANAIRLALLS